MSLAYFAFVCALSFFGGVLATWITVYVIAVIFKKASSSPFFTFATSMVIGSWCVPEDSSLSLGFVSVSSVFLVVIVVGFGLLGYAWTQSYLRTKSQIV